MCAYVSTSIHSSIISLIRVSLKDLYESTECKCIRSIACSPWIGFASLSLVCWILLACFIHFLCYSTSRGPVQATEREKNLLQVLSGLPQPGAKWERLKWQFSYKPLEEMLVEMLVDMVDQVDLTDLTSKRIPPEAPFFPPPLLPALPLPPGVQLLATCSDEHIVVHP